MVSKISTLIPSLNTSLFDLIAFTETWLSPVICNSELHFVNFIIFRCDRSPQTSNRSHGGGVLIAVKNTIKCKVLNAPINNVEAVFVHLHMDDTIFIIGCIYIPPCSPLITYENVFSVLNDLYLAYPSAKFIILGDFNLPSIHWTHLSLPINSTSQIDSYFVNMLSYLNFNQLNHVPNENNVILDLVLSNVHLNVSNDPDPLLPLDKHHPALNVTIDYNQFNLLKQTDFFYDFKCCNYIDIVKFLADNLSYNTFTNFSLDELINHLYDCLNKAIITFVPKKRVSSNRFPSWYSAELKKMVTQKKVAHSLYKQFNDPSDYNNFSRLRANCKRTAKLEYKNHLNKVQLSLKLNPKSFWKYVNNRRNNNFIPNFVTLDTMSADNGHDIVNLFAKFFFKNYPQPDKSITYVPCLNNSLSSNHSFSFSSLLLTEVDVLNELSTLPINFNVGPDNIPAFFLYNCRFILTPALTYIFNLSLQNGKFPDLWKNSFVYPVFKKGDPTNVSNYRPISKISVIPKLFSKLIFTKINNYCSSFLTHHQYGFRPKQSAICNLAITKQIILDSFEAQSQTDIIYTDMSKAFDSINHDILFMKLKLFGFSDPLLSWFRSFISNRNIVVKYLNFESDQFSVPSGVPQGDHLSTLLFNIFINDIPNVIKKSRVFLFADDLKLVKIINNQSDAVDLQNDINNVQSWCSTNRLLLNIDKCKFMRFSLSKNIVNYNYSISNSYIELLTNFKDLGITFDSKLNFSAHTEMIKNKAMRNLGFIKRTCGSFRDPLSLKVLFCALVRSNLEYCPLIWTNNTSKQIDAIESVQNNFLRFISFNFKIYRPPHGSYDTVLSFINLLPLKTRRTLLLSKFLHNLLLGNIDCEELLSLIRFKVNHHKTRCSDLFYPVPYKTNYMKNCPSNILMAAGNSITFDFV